MRIPYDFGGKTVILMVGLPYSGKTTVAQNLRDCGVKTVDDVIVAPVVVSPDAIRTALSGERFLAPLEPVVWCLARMMVRALFLAGHECVIVDATNTTRARRDEWRTSEGWKVVCKHVDTSVSVCMTRAQLAGDSEINGAIERMAAQFEPLEDDEDTL